MKIADSVLWSEYGNAKHSLNISSDLHLFISLFYFSCYRVITPFIIDKSCNINIESSIGVKYVSLITSTYV